MARKASRLAAIFSSITVVTGYNRSPATFFNCESLFNFAVFKNSVTNNIDIKTLAAVPSLKFNLSSTRLFGRAIVSTVTSAS